MRKGVSEVELRMGRKKAATLIYLGLVLFRSDQMITEKKIRTGAGPCWDPFAPSTTVTPPPRADVMPAIPSSFNRSSTQNSPLAILCLFNHLRA
jgi:hypothetical protein